MLNDIDHEIIKAMAKTLWINIYTNATDWEDIAPEVPENVIRMAYYISGQFHESPFFLARKAAIQDLAMDLSKERMKSFVRSKDETPDEWSEWMKQRQPTNEEIKKAQESFDSKENGGDFESMDSRVSRRNCTYLEDFGICLIMMTLGTGVSWFDDHAKFDLKTPYIETPTLEESGWEPK